MKQSRAVNTYHLTWVTRRDQAFRQFTSALEMRLRCSCIMIKRIVRIYGSSVLREKNCSVSRIGSPRTVILNVYRRSLIFSSNRHNLYLALNRASIAKSRPQLHQAKHSCVYIYNQFRASLNELLENWRVGSAGVLPYFALVNRIHPRASGTVEFGGELVEIRQGPDDPELGRTMGVLFYLKADRLGRYGRTPDL